MELEVKIKKLVNEAVIPQNATDGSAGLDLVATDYCYDSTYDNHVYGTGIAVEIPKGFVGLVFPRSSNCKTDSYLTNSVGVIDSDYRGEIKAKFKNRDKKALNVEPYNIGERIAQLVIIECPKIKFVETDTLSETERGAKGYGSTGK